MRSETVFHWPARHSTSLSLPGFLLLALALHALSFYLFQVIYPPPVLLPLPAATIELLDPSRPADQEMVTWAETEDPALLSGHRRQARPGQAALLPLPYAPFYSKTEPALEPLPLQQEEAKMPSAIPAAPVGLERTSALPRQADASFQPVQIIGEQDLARRLPAQLPEFSLTENSRYNGEPVRVLVHILRTGQIDQVYAYGSSGDEEFDRALITYLRSLKLAASSGDDTWEVVTFQYMRAAR